MHHEEHSKYCAAIESLVEHQVQKVYGNHTVREEEVPVKSRRKVMKLVGERPMVKCYLGGKKCEMLWDTGSMITMVDRRWMAENCPKEEVRPVAEFMSEGLRIKAVNTTDIPYDGVILMRWSLSKETEGVMVPVLVTRNAISDPILGNNVIEHVISGKDQVELDALKTSLGGRGVVESLAAVFREKEEDQDFLAEVKVPLELEIPAGMRKLVKCRVKVPVNGEEQIVQFCPVMKDTDDLMIIEAVGTLRRGRTNFIGIEVWNMTDQVQKLKKGEVIGSIHEVSAVIPMMKFAEVNSVSQSNDDKDDEQMKTPTTEDEEKLTYDLSHLEEEQQKLLSKVLEEEKAIFSRNDTDIGDVPACQMKIHLTDTVPVNEAYRRVPPHLYTELYNYINDLVTNGWVRESVSSYSSPIVCVRKKCGAMRMCVDYRRLNAKTVPDAQPIPRIQHILDTLGGNRWFTTLDMSKAYHQGYIHPDSQHVTAFSTPWALYEWLRIPFGLRNAPPVFQRFMNQMLGGLKGTICEPYLDDVLIYGKTFEEQVENLKKVLQRMRKNGVKLRADKCVFAKKEVRYLGRLISENGYRPDPVDAAALDKFKKAPTNVGELRSVLGFVGYFRCYVRDFAKRMKPLYELLKEDEEGKKKNLKKGKMKKGQKYDGKRKIVWTFEHQGILNAMIDYLKSPDVIAFPDYNLPFFMTCDASGFGLGAVLYQQQDGIDRVISYASRTLTEAEKNYHMHSGKLEFLAMKWAITQRFSDYLQFGQPFTVFTDNNPLTYVLSSAKLNAVGMRWVNELADYNFIIKYRPGKENVDADGLSRNPLEVEQLQKECTEKMDKDSLRAIWSGVLDSRNEVYTNTVAVEKLNLEDGEERMSIPAEVLKEKQEKDDVVGPVYRAVLSGVRPDRKEFRTLVRETKILMGNCNKLFMKNGVLMRKTARYEQIVLPQMYKQMVYTELHNKMAHLGVERVTELARQRFYWPRMAHDIEKYVRKQCRCVANKSPNVKEVAPLQPIQVNHPFQLVSLDYMHLDKCKGGYEYCLMVTDHFTKYTQMFGTKNKSAVAAARKIFDQVILQFGYPEKIYSDQGREFDNRLFKELSRLTGIRVGQTSPYHPMSNGKTERANKTLINMLKTLSGEEKKNWKEVLPKLAFAYNSTIHKSTGFTPFYLMFGRESRLPIDTVFRIDEDGGKLSEKSWKRFVDEWKETMKQAYEVATRNMEKASGYNKKYFDGKHKMANPVTLQKGDRVLVQNVREKGGTGKLKSYWEENIFVVEEKKENLPVYKIRSLKRNNDERVVHRNLLLSCNELPLNVFDTEESEVKKGKTVKGTKEKDVDEVPSPGREIQEEQEGDEEIDEIAIYHGIVEDEVSNPDETNGEIEIDQGRVGDEVSNPDESIEEIEIDQGIVEDEMSNPEESDAETVNYEETDEGSDPNESNEDSSDEENVTPRYPSRNHRPPKIMSYDADFQQTAVSR